MKVMIYKETSLVIFPVSVVDNFHLKSSKTEQNL